MDCDKILVVGGYGSVGSAVCRNLVNSFPNKIIAAGRNIKKAEQLSFQMNQEIIPGRIDVSAEQNWDEILSDVRMVVMCVERPHIAFVKKCLSRGIDFIDTSASFEYITAIKKWHDLAKSSGSNVILGVGLSPGITNLMVKYCRDKLDMIISADIFIMLGLGEKHGRAAMEWTLDHINAKFPVFDNGQKYWVESFGEGKMVKFFPDLHQRQAYRFDFADQRQLSGSMGVKSCSTYLCFENRYITNLVARLKKSGILHFLKYTWIKNMMIFTLRSFKVGSDIFRIKVIARSNEIQRGSEYECSISGYNEGVATGGITAIIAEKVYNAKNPRSGVYFLEERFNLMSIINRQKYFRFSEGKNEKVR